MKLKVPAVFSQRDQQWAGILLGYNTSPTYTIGGYGCLITCFGMYINMRPDEVNQLLKDNQGFVDGTGYFIWSKSTVMGLKLFYSSPTYSSAVTNAGLAKMKELLDAGHPLVCEIDFNEQTDSEEMHYVFINGYDETTFYAIDPWTGTQIDMNVYGGTARAVIKFRAYDKLLPKGDGVDLQLAFDQCRVSRDNHWNDLNTIKDELMITGDYALDVILRRIDMLSGIERDYGEKTKQLNDAQKQVIELQKQSADKEIELQNLKSEVAELTMKIDQAIFKNNDLKLQLEEVKKQCVVPPLKGWKKRLYDFIMKGK